MNKMNQKKNRDSLIESRLTAALLRSGGLGGGSGETEQKKTKRKEKLMNTDTMC